GLLQHENADIGDVLTDVQQVRILVGFGFGQEDRPQPAIEHQRVVQVAVRTLPVGLDLLQLPCRFEQRLCLYFPGRCRCLRGASIGLSGMRHSEHPDLTLENAGESAQFLYVVAFKIWLATASVFLRFTQFQVVSTGRAPRQTKTAGSPPPSCVWSMTCGSYRKSCSTLACDWLASASAETAIDCRVERAWLLAASSLVSASVRLDAPVCSTLIRFLLKSWRICTIERFEPSAEDSERNVVDAESSWASTLFAELESRKSVPETRVERPRPASLKVTPWMFRVDRPVSLNTSFSVSPFSRLMPLKDASCEVVLICASTLLYCATRLARVACESGSTTGAPAVRPAKAVAVPPTVPIVEDAASFDVTMVITPVVEMLACRLLAASAVLRSF